MPTKISRRDGFRDIRAFNLALLAKQRWRLLMYPDSILGQIYRARYFPMGTFHNAALGNRHSATWRRSARIYLERAIRYRIVNGNGISIWADPWIPDDGNFRIITPRPFHYGFPYEVSDLIAISRSWNLETISSHLWEVDRHHILLILIGATNVHDRLIWHLSSNWLFTVKPCYHMILSSPSGATSEVGSGTGQGSGSSQINWNLIWRL